MSDEIDMELSGNETANATEEVASGSLLDTIGSFTLPLSGALQLGAAALFFIDKPTKDGENY
jgi:hypothetical protein